MTEPSRESKKALALLNFFQIQGKCVMYTRPRQRVIDRRRAAGKAARKARRHNRV